MNKNVLLLLGFLFVAQSQFAQSFEFTADQIEIPYERFVLPNGLTLLVHEDHKAPIAAVNVWYHVGSKNEKPGKSGFAHLFEHLMFNGSENFNDDYFQALERIGGTDLNGTTNSDRTNYFQNVPVSALDQVLFLESDRMGHLLGAVDQELLDEQRGVVQNEKRQGENQPYGKQYDLLTKVYPKGHPYSWTVIGEMEDLNAASLEDVQEWFKSYYGAANAVVAVAGDTVLV
jgi:zinc protease